MSHTLLDTSQVPTLRHGIHLHGEQHGVLRTVTQRRLVGGLDIREQLFIRPCRISLARLRSGEQRELDRDIFT